jgi:hypothetical protein
MKTKSFRSKKLNSQLAAYSATATAALLVVPAAKATVENITIADLSSNGVAGVVPELSLNGTAQTLSLTAAPFAGSFAGFSFNVVDLAGQIAATQNGKVDVLAEHATIVGLNFANNGSHTLNGFGVAGPANGAVTDYVGFKAHQNAQTYYGWLRVQIGFNNGGVPDNIQLVSKAGNPDIFGAYGTTSDNVWAGQIVATPEPSVAALGGLALLACGAAGVREMRRRRQVETAKAE